MLELGENDKYHHNRFSISSCGCSGGGGDGGPARKQAEKHPNTCTLTCTLLSLHAVTPLLNKFITTSKGWTCDRSQRGEARGESIKATLIKTTWFGLLAQQMKWLCSGPVKQTRVWAALLLHLSLFIRWVICRHRGRGDSNWRTVLQYYQYF